MSENQNKKIIKLVSDTPDFEKDFAEDQIEVMTQDHREVELLEKNRKLNLKKLFTPEGMDSMIATIEKEVADFSADISTKKGQTDVKSMAYRISCCKSPIEKLAKELKEDSRKFIDSVNQQWNRYEAAMDNLKDKIRKPVDEIEEREAKLLAERKERVERIKNHSILYNSTLYDIEVAISNIKQILDFDNWGEFQFAAEEAAKETLAQLENLHAQKQEQIKKDAELEQLRKEAAERAQRDREEQIAREAAEKAKIDAERAADIERNRIIREQKEAEENARRAEAAKKAAEDRAKESERLRLEQEESAKRKKVIDDRISQLSLLGMFYNGTHESFLFEDVSVALLDVKLLTQEEWVELMNKIKPAIEERKAAEAEKEKKRIADEAVEREREKVAMEKNLAAIASEKAAANKKHCAKINNEAKSSLSEIIIKANFDMTDSESLAKSIVEAIAKGQVPHVSIKY